MSEMIEIAGGAKVEARGLAFLIVGSDDFPRVERVRVLEARGRKGEEVLIREEGRSNVGSWERRGSVFATVNEAAFDRDLRLKADYERRREALRSAVLKYKESEVPA